MSSNADLFPATEEEPQSSQEHYIRHITGIFVRNLTPYPKRDTVASALNKPSNALLQAADGTYGLDDADLTLSERRSRKLSSGSIVTQRSFRHAEEPESPASPVDGIHKHGSATDVPRKPRRISRGSLQLIHTSTSSSPPPVSSSPIVRRGRSLSQASYLSSLSSSGPNKSQLSSVDGNYSYSSPSALTQRSLEKVVSSRLVETFVTLSLPGEEPPPPTSLGSKPPLPLANGSEKAVGNSSRGKSHVKQSSSSSGRLQLSQKTSRPPPTDNKAVRVKIAPSTSVPVARNPSASQSSASSHSTAALPSTRPDSRPSSPAVSEPVRHMPPPFYVSHPHRPSTNPSWVSLFPEREFSSRAPPQTSRLEVALWGTVAGSEAWATSRPALGTSKGKGKERATDRPGLGATGWHPLIRWDIDLEDARRLPRELEDNQERLPPNSLLLRLGPSDELFYFPVPPLSRPATPPGHASDGEADPRNNSPKSLLPSKSVPYSGETRQETLNKSLREARMKPSAGWQDLVRLVTLEAVLVDTQHSLDEVVEHIDAMLLQNQVMAMERESSERELLIQNLREQEETVRVACTSASKNLDERKLALQKRRKALGTAQSLYRDDLVSNQELRETVDEEKNNLELIVHSLLPQRDRLIRAVEFIFPIEPFSSGELLFSILGVPLPLPSGPNDPAPPLSLSSQPSITEETVASALGYAAQVTQLLGVYLGQILPYPITYAGSRSMIKDPISTMQGPRVFPLFSKGVETYRFEYAVFLLNKDIEMLMSDRNLRAMDMRHTLPNLKNLLLTLTSGSGEDNNERHVAIRLPGSPDPTLSTSSLPVSASPNPDRGSAVVPVPRRQLLSPLAAILRSKYTSAVFPASVQEEQPDTEHIDGPSEHNRGDSGEASTSNHDSASDSGYSGDCVLDPSSHATRDGQADGESRKDCDGDDAAGSGEIGDEDARTERGVPVDTVEEAKPENGGKKSGAVYGFTGTWSSLWLRGEKSKDHKDVSDPKSGPEPPPPPLQFAN